MNGSLAADLRNLHAQLDAIDQELQIVIAGLREEEGDWQPQPGSWSISECLDHLATGNRVYLEAMQEPIRRARFLGRHRSRPALPGLIGRLFVRSFEPPPTWWTRRKSPRIIRPRNTRSLGDTLADFVDSHQAIRAFLLAHADLDLARIRFPNPFVRGIRFSIATGLHLLAAHERRHLWQALQVRRRLQENEGRS